MTTKEITNNENVIDSRDIIERLELLESDMEDFKSDRHLPSFDIDDKWNGSEYEEWDANHKRKTVEKCAEIWNSEWEFAAEYRSLKKIADECEGYGDWKYGETLIRESYWQEYIEELIEDCYMTTEMRNMMSQWPWRHLDMEAAAEEAKIDYAVVDFDGVDYYIRNC